MKKIAKVFTCVGVFMIILGCFVMPAFVTSSFYWMIPVFLFSGIFITVLSVIYKKFGYEPDESKEEKIIRYKKGVFDLFKFVVFVIAFLVVFWFLAMFAWISIGNHSFK